MGIARRLVADQANRTDLALVLIAAALYTPRDNAAMVALINVVAFMALTGAVLFLLAMMVGMLLDGVWG